MTIMELLRRSGVDATLALGLLLQPRARPRRSHGGGQGLGVVGALVAPAVDEEARRARHAAGVRTSHILFHPLRVLVMVELVPEALDIQAKLVGVAGQVTGRELVLVLEEL